MKKFLLNLMIPILALVMVASPVSASQNLRGMDVALPVYVWPDSDYMKALLDPNITPFVPEVIVVNIENGDGDVSVMDSTADALHARRDANGRPPKVIGYVYTSYANRPMADVKHSVDLWLTARNGKVHYDGIFFDETTRDCGSAPGLTDYRDYFRALRQYVWDSIPQVEDIVVNNPGTAVADCYLQKGKRTADIFVTFEGEASAYRQIAGPDTGWQGYLGGNVFNSSGYRAGNEYDSNSFWHLIYNAPANVAEQRQLIQLAYDRYAGNVGVTSDFMTNTWLNPWDDTPAYLAEQLRFARKLPL